MRTTDTSALTFNAFRPAGRRGSWTGRIVLAALLLAAAAAFALLPDRADAQEELPRRDQPSDTIIADNLCQPGNTNDPDYPTDVIPPNPLLSDYYRVGGGTTGNVNTGIIADCVAVLKAGRYLTEGSTETHVWIADDADEVPAQLAIQAWQDVDLNVTSATTSDPIPRIIRVNVTDNTIGGQLAPEWANLSALTSLTLSGTEDTTTGLCAADGITGSLPDKWVTGFHSLTTLNLSGNALSGRTDRSVWEYLTKTRTSEDGPNLVADVDGDNTTVDPGLNLSNNPNLHPSPPLGLIAKVDKGTGNNDGKTKVTLTWDHTGWYTQAENSDAAIGPVVTHTYQVCEEATCTAQDWRDVTPNYTDGGTAVTGAAINAKGTDTQSQLCD